MHIWSTVPNRSGVEGIEPAGDSSLIFRQQKSRGRVASTMHYVEADTLVNSPVLIWAETNEDVIYLMVEKMKRGRHPRHSIATCRLVQLQWKSLRKLASQDSYVSQSRLGADQEILVGLAIQAVDGCNGEVTLVRQSGQVPRKGRRQVRAVLGCGYLLLFTSAIKRASLM